MKMRKNMKGFTLIELLAVIVILAIIALIAVPLVMDVITDAKKSAASSEAKLIVQGVENYCASEALKKSLNSGYTIICTDPVAPATTVTLTAGNLASMVDIPSTTTVSIKIDGDGKVDSTSTITSNGCSVNITTWVATC